MHINFGELDENFFISQSAEFDFNFLKLNSF